MQGKLHQYNITANLAKKYSHATYLASPTNEPERQVVLIVFTSSLFSSLHEREEVLQKAQRIKELQHPHLLPILDMGIDKGQPFIVRDYLPNETLRSRLKQLSPQRLALRDALTIALQVGEALAYAHQHNILHGNIKPENILFDANGQALLTDFTLINSTDAMIRDQIADEYAFCYMAPEQLAGTSNKLSEQYAIGCLTYELLAGKAPFTSQGLNTMMGQYNTIEPVPLSEQIPNLVPSLNTAILKILKKDPDERFFDFSLFLEVIRSVLSPPPTFPLSRSAASRKPRNSSRPVHLPKAHVVLSSSHKVAVHSSPIPQTLEASGTLPHMENDKAEIADISIIVDASMPEQAEIALTSELLEPAAKDNSLTSLLSPDTSFYAARDRDSSNHPLQISRDNSFSTFFYRVVTQPEVQIPDTLQTFEEDADDVWLTDPFAKQESTELPVTVSVSPVHKQRKLEVDNMASSSPEHTNRPVSLTRRTWQSLGLVLVCLVIVAFGTYAVLLPLRTHKIDNPVHPTQVTIQPTVPVQKSISPTQLATLASPIATMQPTPQTKTTPSIISTSTPTPAPIPTSTMLQTTVIDDSIQGTGINQFNYVGNGWQHNSSTCEANPCEYNGSNSWDNTINDYVTLTFTGVQIKFYGVSDTVHGIGAVSVDGGSETLIDFYAASRASQLLWTSPTMPEGTHTFKLRVTGNKNSNSSDTFVTVDRVDILG